MILANHAKNNNNKKEKEKEKKKRNNLAIYSWESSGSCISSPEKLKCSLNLFVDIPLLPFHPLSAQYHTSLFYDLLLRYLRRIFIELS